MNLTTQLIAATLITVEVSLSAVMLSVQAFTISQNNDFTERLNRLFGDTVDLTNIIDSLNGNSAAFGSFENASCGLDSVTALSTDVVEQIDVSEAELYSAVVIKEESLIVIPIDSEKVPESPAIASLLLLGLLGTRRIFN